MKKSKLLIISVLSLTLLTGCFKRDTMDGITIHTTTYPIEYLVENIYGYNSTVDSIYPNGVDTTEYKLTNKQIKEYATTDLFIYNGLTKEKTIAASFLNNNKNLKIIDVTKGVALQVSEEELWLCPSNYLMLAQNIKNELTEYSNSTIVKQEILEKYEDLKLVISKYDAELKLIAENSENPTIIVGNDVFNFLEKYGFKVLSVQESDLFDPSEFQEAKNNVNNDTNNYIFILNTDEISENTKKIEDAGATIVKINSIRKLTDTEEAEGYDYIQMMEAFIDSLKTEVYN